MNVFTPTYFTADAVNADIAKDSDIVRRACATWGLWAAFEARCDTPLDLLCSVVDQRDLHLRFYRRIATFHAELVKWLVCAAFAHEAPACRRLLEWDEGIVTDEEAIAALDACCTWYRDVLPHLVEAAGQVEVGSCLDKCRPATVVDAIARERLQRLPGPRPDEESFSQMITAATEGGP